MTAHVQQTCFQNLPFNIVLDLQEAEEKQRSVIGKRMTAPKAFPRVALDLATTVERIQQNFVICDPNLPDCPIVFASDGFIELTEYPRHEVLGRNCRYVWHLQPSNTIYESCCNCQVLCACSAKC